MDLDAKSPVRMIGNCHKGAQPAMCVGMARQQQGHSTTKQHMMGYPRQEKPNSTNLFVTVIIVR